MTKHLTFCCDGDAICQAPDGDSVTVCNFAEELHEMAMKPRPRGVESFVVEAKKFKSGMCTRCMRRLRWTFRANHGAGTSR